MARLVNDINIYIEYGNNLLKSKKYNEAETLFIDARTKWPEEPLPYIGAANAAHSNNNYELSLKRWEIAREKFPANLQILKGLGSIYLDLKEYDKANKCFSEAHDLESNSFDEMNKFMSHVNELIFSENFTEAEALLIDAQKKWPEKISPFHTHQRLLEKKRRRS